VSYITTKETALIISYPGVTALLAFETAAEAPAYDISLLILCWMQKLFFLLIKTTYQEKNQPVTLRFSHSISSTKISHAVLTAYLQDIKMIDN